MEVTNQSSVGLKKNRLHLRKDRVVVDEGAG